MLTPQERQLQERTGEIVLKKRRLQYRSFVEISAFEAVA